MVYCFVFIHSTVGAFRRGTIFIFEPMKMMTQQGTTKAETSAMRGRAWVIVVQVVGYLINLGLSQDSGVPLCEGGERLSLVMVEGGNVVP